MSLATRSAKTGALLPRGPQELQLQSRPIPGGDGAHGLFIVPVTARGRWRRQPGERYTAWRLPEGSGRYTRKESPRARSNLEGSVERGRGGLEGEGFPGSCPSPTIHSRAFSPSWKPKDQGHAVSPIIEMYFVQKLPHEEDAPARRLREVRRTGGIGNVVGIEPAAFIGDPGRDVRLMERHLHLDPFGGIVAVPVENGVRQGLGKTHPKVEAEPPRIVSAEGNNSASRALRPPRWRRDRGYVEDQIRSHGPGGLVTDSGSPGEGLKALEGRFP